ncbi:MAG: hypothetical protein ACPGGK_12610 [Pikeienuella sp.]
MRIVFLVSLISAFCLPLAAQALDVSDVPHVSDRTRGKIEKDYDRSRSQDTYTLAISRSGYWGSTASGRGEAGDLVRGALQKCEHAAQERCGLAAMNGENVEFREYPPQIRYVRELDINSIPFIWSKGRDRLSDDYIGQSGHKALVLSRNGGYGFAYDEASADAAVEKAMGYCTKNGKRACFVYEVNDKVVFNRETNIFKQQTEKNW